MADIDNKVDIGVQVRTDGEELVTALTAKMKALETQAKRINDSMKQIGRVPSNPGGKDPAKTEAAAENVRAKSRRSKKQADADTLRSAKALDSFDKASIALFKTKLSSQTKAASEALKTERQSFAKFRTRNAAQSRYESSQVRALKDRMTAERRIAAMRTGAENEVVRQLKQKLNLQSQSETARQREASKAQRDQVKSDAAGVRSVRNLINTRSRMAAQRLAEERSAAREAARGLAANAIVAQAAERYRLKSIRDAGNLQIQEDRRVARERASNHRTFRSSASDAYQRTGEGYRALSRPGPVVAAVAGGAAAVATRKAISTRGDTDSAETNLRIFGSEPASGSNPGSTMTQSDVVKLREEWLDKAALDNGLTPAEAIRAYTEVLKAGVPTTQARGVAEQLMASRAGMDLELNAISKLTGKVLTNRPDLDLKKFQTSFAISAGTTAADPNEIVQGYQRGMGALAGSNMSPEDLTAFIATGVGSGIQAGKTGNFIAETVATLSTAGKERGQRRKDLDLAGRMTGFGNAQGMSAAMAKDAASTMETLFERMSKMDAQTRSHVSRLIGQRNWDDEELQMVNSVATLKKTRQAVNDPRNSDYLDKAKSEKMNSWGGMWSKSLSVFNLFWEKFGAGFDGLLRDVNAFFLEVGRTFDFNKVTDVVRSALDGIKSGLGLNTWKEGFDQIKQWMSSVDIKSTMASFTGFAKGFARGVSDVVSSIKKVASLFGTGDTSSEDIGRWTARFMGLSIALAALGPVLGVLGGLVSLVVGLGRAATAIRALVGLGGGAATGATAGAATGAGLLFKGLGLTLSRLFALGLVAEIGSNKEVISAWLLEAGKNILQAAIDGLKSAFSKEAILAAMKAITSEFIPAPVERWLNKDGKLEEKGGLGKKTLEGLPKGIPAAPVDPNERGYIGKAWGWITSSLVGSAAASELPPGLRGQVNTATAIPKEPATPSLDPRPATRETVETVRANPLIQKQSFGSDGELRSLISKASFADPDAVMSGTVDTASIAKPTADPRRELVDLTDALRQNSAIHRASMERQGIMGGLIHRAYITSASDGVRSSLAQSSADMKSPSIGGSIGQGGLTGGSSGSPLSGSVPGSALNGGSGLSRRGIIGGGGGAVSPSGKMEPGSRAGSLTSLIEQEAKAAGIDPRIMHGIRAGESGHRADYDKKDDALESSWGPFQLNRKRGLGQDFEKETGLDVRNPATIGAQARWVAQYIAKKRAQNPNWNPGQKWMGYRGNRDSDPRWGESGYKPDPNAGSSGGDAVPSSANDNATSSQVLQTARNLSVANQQCVSLAKAAVGASGSVMNWQRGVSAEAGTLKPGTPVATFMDALGRQSSRYAGGGTGTMGANRDHAGIFQEYIKDAAGKNIGMRIAEQYRGSGGVHSKDYMFGQGSGAKNGSNYNVVLGPDGQPLGGSRNPMNRTVTAKAPVVEAVKAQVSLPEMSAKGFGLGIQTPKPVSVPNPGKDIATAKPAVPDISAMSGEIARNSSWKSDAIKSWKPSDGNKATPPVADGVEAQSITGRLPGRNADAPGGIPAAGVATGGNSSSSATTNNININGSNLNSEEIANAVQRKASEGMRRQSTGASPYSYI